MPKNTPIRIIDSQKTRAAAFLGGSGSGGGFNDHGLLNGLGDDDHAQYLRTDGTRTLTGNMLVDASVTIDGVDISAHAANANAHHNQQHAITGSDHTVTGSQYQIVGLTSTNTLGLLTAASSPTANQIVKTDGSSMATLVDLTVTSDLFMSGTLDFGTNTIAEDATYLQVAGSKAVRFAQNIGNANWTLYNAGGYTTTGSISITGTAGDLTVGSNVLFVDNSQANVGINMAPDSQFALDINGPARATYWIGPHAIQLSNVVMLCHYDGNQWTTQGEYNGHMGQVATVTGGVAMLPGKFGKAVVSAAAASNYVTNPSFETGTTGWSASGATLTQSAAVAYVGRYSLKCVASTSNQAAYQDITGLSNATYNISGYLWIESGVGVRVQIYDAGAFTNSQSTTYTTRGQWIRFSTTRSVTNGGMRIWVRDNVGACTWFLDGLQVTNTAHLQPYLDGSMGINGTNDYTWTGTAHASQSYRYETRLRYDNAMIPRTDGSGTIAAWFITYGYTGADRIIVERYSGTGDFAVYLNSSTQVVATFCGATITSSAVTADAWHYVAVTWNGATFSLYIDGVQSGSATAYTFATNTATYFCVGCATNSPYRQLNGLIDDLTILSQEMPAALVRSVYESNAPVFAETSTFSFRPTPKGLLWADDEGLWMRDTSGNPVFGIYGGESTKSWGGFTMAPGDLLMGNNAVGAAAILWDQSAGTFGFYGAGNATAQASVATDGSITAGGGKVKLSVDGLTAFNASNAATIYVDANGISTGDGGGRTTIGTWTSGSRIKWYTVGEIYAATPETYLDDSSVSRTLYPLVMRSIRQGNDAAIVEISAVNTSNVGAFLRVGEGFRLKDYYGNPYYTNRMVHANATDIILECTNLKLYSLTTSTSAVGTYSGKVRINIGGTNYYIPYYAS